MEIVINKEWCKGCALCIQFCPKGCLSMGSQLNSKGSQYPLFTEKEECSGCAACGKLCPDLAIDVYKT